MSLIGDADITSPAIYASKIMNENHDLLPGGVENEKVQKKKKKSKQSLW